MPPSPRTMPSSASALAVAIAMAGLCLITRRFQHPAHRAERGYPASAGCASGRPTRTATHLRRGDKTNCRGGGSGGSGGWFGSPGEPGQAAHDGVCGRNGRNADNGNLLIAVPLIALLALGAGLIVLARKRSRKQR